MTRNSLSQNNPLYRLIDQITSRFEHTTPFRPPPPPPHSSHRRTPVRSEQHSETGHFYSWGQPHPSLPPLVLLPSFLPSISPSPTRPHPPPSTTPGWQSRESAIFYFTYERGTAAWRFINNKLRWFLRGLEREREREREREFPIELEGGGGERRPRLLGGINPRSNIGRGGRKIARVEIFDGLEDTCQPRYSRSLQPAEGNC